MAVVYRLQTVRLRKGSEGFVLIELMIAALLLAVGLLALFQMLDVVTKVTITTKAREGAVTLARELTEDVHSVAYDQVSPSTITATLQALPGMAPASAGAWQVQRRGITYTLSATECSIDDPKDGLGVHDATFCADSTATGTADSQPIDFKRVTVNVSWNAGVTTHSYSETTTLSSAGQAASLTTSNLVLASPSTSASGMSGSNTQPTVTSGANGSLTFSVTAPSGATGIIWTVNGSNQTWTSSVSGTTWTSSPWNITALSDGTYTVGAAAQDAAGVIGAAVTIPVRLARNVPTAPAVTGYGFNTAFQASGAPTTAAEFQWQKNPELNVTGYKVYNPSGTLICTTGASPSGSSCGSHAWCTTATLVNCVDLTPPATSATNLTYSVAALYYDANNNIQQGPATQVTLTGGNSSPFTFAASSANTGSNCSGTALRDLNLGSASGTDTTQNGSATFCSAAYSSGQQVSAGGTATAWLANPGTGACTETATFSVNGTSNAASSALTLGAGSAITKYTFPFSGTGLIAMGAGDRINVSFAGTGTNCTPVMHLGSSTYPSGFTTGLQPVGAPSPVPSVTVTPGGGNTASLTWNAPSSTGTPISFYRVYRDSGDYTGRYDIVDPSTCTPTCTYVDKNHTASHSYWVTAVGGTTAGANMAESTATGPVSG